jgi:hypothetical protein
VALGAQAKNYSLPKLPAALSKGYEFNNKTRPSLEQGRFCFTQKLVYYIKLSTIATISGVIPAQAGI